MIPEEYSSYFWEKVDKTSECWEWTGAKNEKGYGRFTFGYQDKKRTVRAHRAVYTALVGEIPKGKYLDHTCYNPACVNPEHLRPVTNKQNLENRSGAYSATGVRNVYLNVRGKPYVQVKHHGKLHRRYGFDSVEEAAEAARQLRLQLFTHNDADRLEGEPNAVQP